MRDRCPANLSPIPESNKEYFPQARYAITTIPIDYAFTTF